MRNERAETCVAISDHFFIDRPWLIIYDNVDDLSVLDDFKVPSSIGHVIITSRDPQSGVFPLEGGIPVTPFSSEESRSFFFGNLGIESTTTVTSEFNDLLQEWDGLPMALDQMSCLIRQKGWTLEGFLTMYKESRPKMHSMQKSYASDWGYRNTTATAFCVEFLDDEHRRLLHAMCFLDPDKIYDESRLLGGSDPRYVLLSMYANPLG